MEIKKKEWKKRAEKVKGEGMKSKPERIKLVENLTTGGKSNSHARLGREKSFPRNWRGRELVTGIPRSHNGEQGRRGGEENEPVSFQPFLPRLRTSFAERGRG